LGPNAILDSIVINRGYATGGRPGTPLATHLGLVGRVLKASAHSAIVLLLTDPGSRIAVLSQNERASGILAGMGPSEALEVLFVQRDVSLSPGELLFTSGMDGKFPKGIPVARVLSAAPSDYTQFLAVRAEPLVDLRHLEEVLLLEATGLTPIPEEDDAAAAPADPAMSGKTEP
jgi:rod shape-determining protein MreC